MIFDEARHATQQVTPMPAQEVREHFPPDIAQRYGLTERQVEFFGLVSTGALNDGTGVFRDKYLVLLGKDLPPQLQSLSFADSTSKYIRSEHDEIMHDDYDILKRLTPLLLLRINSHVHAPAQAFRFSELLRYADHAALRRRGVATATIDALLPKLRSEGTEYLEVFPYNISWPSASKPIWKGWMPHAIMDDIDSCIHPEYRTNWWSDVCFYFTDRELHDEFYATIESKKTREAQQTTLQTALGIQP